MEEFRRWAPNMTVICVTLAIQVYVLRQLLRRAPQWRRQAWAGFAFATAWMAVAVPYLISHRTQGLSSAAISYLVAGSLFWVLVMTSAAVWLKIAQPVLFDPRRRHLLALAAPAAAAPLVSAGFGVIVARQGPRVTEISLPFQGLPKDLHGLRIAQLTDIHYGPFLNQIDLRRAVDIANELRPHLTVLTGDLITRRGDDLEGCLQVLKALRSDAGVFGCHGNHEYYAGTLDLTTRLGARAGLRFLRGESALLRFGAANLQLAGHDYEKMGSRYLPGLEAMVRPDAFNLLLQHNPDVFPRASSAGFQAILSGHTHGGQINVEILEENVNVARFFTPYVKVRYEIEGRQLYVSSGLGTVGVPIRLGAPPEVTLIKLCGA
ncbi:MAG: metallophosphoesterase [Acidobacteria bacterium]|nr:metallophosphoesterase [Acidobacteriota bacterium]